MTQQQIRDQHAATFQKWADAISNGDVNSFVACFAADAVVEDIAMGTVTRGEHDIREAASRWFQAMGDEKLTLLAHLEGDGHAAVMWELSGVAQGTFTELSTDVKPGSRFAKQGMSAFRFTADGLFAWERSHWDRASLRRQIEGQDVR
ncbi:nuclear transport factor 2 family protein [Actinomadura terrae]|uniref:nuclear transport factor 2 family protein n=1 Tax=Actinomadura terrae TaxID=604353 RepID=UPI001FA7F8D6|nr:nuclear transport factor 2 family protein [Actinomadura terrae]